MVDIEHEAGDVAAIILAGGRSVRLDGADKATLEHAGRTLLDHALDAVAAAGEVVVVGDPVPTQRPVTFTREDPAYGGPVAALLTGRDALLRTAPPARRGGGGHAVPHPRHRAPPARGRRRP